MKYFITLCVIAIFCTVSNQAKISPEQQQILKQKSEECKAETKVDPQLIENAKKGESVTGDEFKAYAICLTTRLLLLNENGDVQSDKALSYLPPEEDKAAATKSLENCQKIKVDDLNNTKYLRSICIYKNFYGLL